MHFHKTFIKYSFSKGVNESGYDNTLLSWMIYIVFFCLTFLEAGPFSRKILEFFRTVTVVLKYESYFRKDFTPLWAYYTKQMPRKH